MPVNLSNPSMITPLLRTMAREILLDMVMPMGGKETPVPSSKSSTMPRLLRITGRDQPSSFRTTTPDPHLTITTVNTVGVGGTSTTNNTMLDPVPTIMIWRGENNF